MDNIKDKASFVVTARKLDDVKEMYFDEDMYFGKLTSFIILGIDTDGNFDFNCAGDHSSMEMADLCINSMKVLLELHKMLKDTAIKDSTDESLSIVDNITATPIVKYADTIIEKLKSFEDYNV